MLLVLFALVVGCASEDDTSTKSDTAVKESTSEETAEKTDEGEAAESAEPVEKANLTWVGWSGEEEATKIVLDKIMGDWNESQEMSSIEWIGWPWSNTLEQIIIRGQSNEGLDVAQIDMGWLATLAETGYLADLNELIDKEWMESNISEGSLKAGQVDGKQIALPWTAASIGMMYNPSLLDEAGVAAVPETIEEFEAALKAIKDMNPEVIPYAAVTKDAGSVAKDLEAWLWTFGGSVFSDNGEVTINSPESIEAITWLKSMVDNGYIALDMTRFDARTLMAQNRVGFYDDAIMGRSIAISNGVDEAVVDSMITPMLRPVVTKGDKPQSVLWGHQLVVFENGVDKKAAADYLKYVISEETALYYYEETGLVPVVDSAIQSDAVTSNAWSNEWLKTTATGSKAQIQNYVNTKELSEIIAEEFQAALFEAKDIQVAMDDAASRIETAVQ